MTNKIVLVVLGLIFLLSGGAKLAGLQFELDAFARWGYPVWFMYFTGAAEVGLAFGLLIKPLRKLTLLGFVGIMLGAVATHIINAEWAMLSIAASILGLAIWQAVDSWRQSTLGNSQI